MDAIETWKAAHNAYHANYRKTHREYFREAARKYYAKAGQSDQRKYTEYKAAAKKRNLEFTLTLAQFSELRTRECLYCGSKNESMGIDRTDNMRGYILDNVASCCAECNYMKSDMSLSDFTQKCSRIASRLDTIHLSTHGR